ncbi:MAG: PEP-CTERM sorting domain-containing protein [Betaproteobacteria bacterium]|nr:PEP-CTERM sorting domain-containing protein [Betaproteobacteria bacterium]
MWKKLAFCLCLASAISPVSRAAVTIHMAEVGSNVVATLSGAINSLPSAPTQSGPVGAFSGVRPSGSTMILGFSQFSGVQTVQMDYYTATTYPSNFGTSTSLLQANTSTASTAMQFRNLSANNIIIDQSYVLGTAVTGTLTWNNKTFSSMGVATGSYVWGWSSDSITLNVVPEPSTLALLAVGLGGVIALRRLRRKAD